MLLLKLTYNLLKPSHGSKLHNISRLEAHRELVRVYINFNTHPVQYISTTARKISHKGNSLVTPTRKSRNLCSSMNDTSSTMDGSIEEAVACKVDDMKDGEMKQIDIGKGHALVVRENGVYTAIGHKCTHYGAPLVKGSLLNGIVRCPWHGACFNVKTGDIEDFPGLDAIPKFETSIVDGNVVVRANTEDLKSHKKIVKMCKLELSEDSRTFLLLGGGAASLECAETLRKQGFKGKIVIATKENLLPYDRVILSKMLKKKGEEIALRPKEFYEQYDIEVALNKEAAKLDASGKTLTFADGTAMKYDKLFVGTGGSPRTLDVPGSDLENVCYLRTPDDANAIAAACEGKKLLVIGTSFIGLEVAAFGIGKGGGAASVDVVGQSPTPFAKVFGPAIGERMTQLHQEKGVKFHFNTTVKEFKGKNGKLVKVLLSSGEQLDADVCVVGVGVNPSTGFAKDCAINMNKNGSIIVDKYLQACEDVFVGGDIASFPLKMLNDQQVTIGHWQLSHAHGILTLQRSSLMKTLDWSVKTLGHGKAAALNMMGKKKEIETVPFFWTMQYGKSIRYAGHAADFDDIVVEGSVDDFSFVAYYIKGNDVLAVATMGRDPVAAHAANLFFNGIMPKADEIRVDPSTWHSSVSA